MENINLKELRTIIDQIDSEIIQLLSKRFDATEKVGIYKAKNNLMAQDTTRESEKFEKIIKLSEETNLNPDYSVEIFRCIMDVAISRHREIQGRVNGTDTSTGHAEERADSLTRSL